MKSTGGGKEKVREKGQAARAVAGLCRRGQVAA